MTSAPPPPMDNTSLVVNPLYFHGIAVSHYLRSIFIQMINVQNFAVLTKQANDTSEPADSKFKSTNQDKPLKDMLERMSIGLRKSSQDIHHNALSLLLEHSRLVYSGSTIKLFHHITLGMPGT
jgi:hypothetical protein